MRVLIAGSHGLIGSHLSAALREAGHHVTPLVRALPGPGEAAWDPKEGTVDAAGLEGHDAAVHIAGAGLGDHRWTDRYKAEIVQSRVAATDLLARTLAALDRPPAVLVAGSAVGWYGDRGDEELTEDSSPGTGFLADVCRRWEAAADLAREAGIRTVHLRTGPVQTPRGAGLKRLLLPFKLGIGGRLGSGRQWLSWISLRDHVAATMRLLEDQSMSGPFNLTAPNPVTFGDYTKAIGRALHRPSLMPAPTVALYTILGRELVREMVLGGQRVLPARLTAAGFTFRDPVLEPALKEMLA